MKSYNVVLIGDSCEDVYHYGTCERLSPEAPVPVLKQTQVTRLKGMSWNVRLNLEAFGVSVRHFTNDKKIVKHRFIDTQYNQHLLRWDEGEEGGVEKFDTKLLSLYNEIDAVVISDYNKGFLTHDICKKIVEYYNDIPIFVDTKKTDLSCFENCYIKINEKENSKIVRYPRDKSKIIVTLGSKGAKYLDVVHHSHAVEVFDVCGAGDVFLASLVYEFLETGDIASGITKANKMAGISVSHMGTYVLTQEDINE